MSLFIKRNSLTGFIKCNEEKSGAEQSFSRENRLISQIHLSHIR